MSTVHDRETFDCGNEALNSFFKNVAGQHDSKSVSKTFVIADDEDRARVAGFYTLAMRKLTPKEQLPPEIAKRLPASLPGITLARLAVDKNYQRRGVGEDLLLSAMSRAKKVSHEIGGFALFVDAKDGVAEFYKNYGFTPLPSNPLILLIPFKNIPDDAD
ncbi:MULTISPECIES: GNAT family N-acetyltransferase [unclassified Undibacterium]|uniref:GNAT family N-acetyltransferase n=1 Tax=unclassified Undibacterium TaxID=2630295 RepID=UPI002AC89868|nr:MULTISPECIES: GNAT family N-acetyltransferase [unclassified Undibacterium]MEB0141209.1 GNAT family N-acetyltransferase [Undibacterium sp. CCC2.1]MEB0174273.1 GNAT family N-acetyltransferase [Undibacterium sp. CCC1.1]MEB0178207.1 GNAT family N-acetyltransferase [Undibacterium sp. CCC3.4]MEB0215387.1 GNAT family N-acetyltransferase [Undibacterium sp. 5I2]WPX42728.1 GNAT family N-acetyltransferase [Undibacterium sp. CCC3.4]